MANEPTRFGAIAVDDPIPAEFIEDTDYEIAIPFFQAGDAAAPTTKRGGWIAPFACTYVGHRFYADTAPVGAALIADVNKNDVSLFTTQGARPTIADGANAGSTTLPDITTIAAGDRITWDIDQVGSGTAGADLYLSLLVRRALV